MRPLTDTVIVMLPLPSARDSNTMVAVTLLTLKGSLTSARAYIIESVSPGAAGAVVVVVGGAVAVVAGEMVVLLGTFRLSAPSMTPQAYRAPESPVVLLLLALPRPRSSFPACSTIERPTTDNGPLSCICAPVIRISEMPLLSVMRMLPRSPAWRTADSRPPCVITNGL